MPETHELFGEVVEKLEAMLEREERLKELVRNLGSATTGPHRLLPRRRQGRVTGQEGHENP